MQRIANRKAVAFGVLITFAIACLGAYWWYLADRERRAVDVMQAMISGDRSISISQIDVLLSKWEILCDDPNVLRYVESSLQASAPQPNVGMTTHELRIHFDNGLSIDVWSYWFDRGFFIFLPGSSLMGENGVPSGVVLFKNPIPDGANNLITTMTRYK